MSDLRTAALQALEALENHTAIKHPQQMSYRDAAITALRAALAEPEPLTSEQLRQIELGLRIYCDYDKYDLSLHDFARAIERAHGIGASDE